MIDLGAWAAEAYRVPVVEDPDSDPMAAPDATGGRRSRAERDAD